MSNRDRAIIAQTSAKVAGELCHGTGREGLDDYLVCAETIFNDIIDRSGGGAPVAAVPAAAAPPVMSPAPSPVAQVQPIFPGAEIAVAPGGDAPPPAAPPAPAPAAAKPAGRARK